ncbi:MAG: hypothetical protein R3293_14500 [Candidatus Promineifilaceae bacterium]|nr:hypothetical protein [Candidatus Promineifilaceae bacterium]
MPDSAPEPIPQEFLADIRRFSREVIGLSLYDYQIQPLRPIINSVFQGLGHEFLLVFSRQSGKNEAIAQLLVYLLNHYHDKGGSIVFAAIGDGLGRGIRRLEERLDNRWNRDQWRKKGRPSRRILGQAAVVFISSHPQTAARGETADLLLVIDELQDQDLPHIEAVFTPMRAARNATAVYLGTVRTRHDALWLKKEELERQTVQDSFQRVFSAGPEVVTLENEQYGRFLEQQIRKHGRSHPIIASEYFLEPLDDNSGLFPPRRLALIRGSHERRRHPSKLPAIALLDVGGQDEAATDPLAQLHNPARDYTVCTIVEVDPTADRTEPIYRAVDIFVDQGSRHFESFPGRPALAERLLAYLEHWQVALLVGDATGVGEGLCGWLSSRLSSGQVIPFKFTRRSKAALGAAFVTLIETGRFKYWSGDQEQQGSDGFWFWTQAAHCTYDLPAGGSFERDLRWYVPPSARIATPSGRKPVHDDRLISAALVAEADRIIAGGGVRLGQAQSSIIAAVDPLEDLSFS